MQFTAFFNLMEHYNNFKMLLLSETSLLEYRILLKVLLYLIQIISSHLEPSHSILIGAWVPHV